MLLYQALIMAVIVIAIYLLAFLVKFKKRKFLVVSIIVLLIAGGIGLYAVQYFFSNHYYTQKVDTGAIEAISLTDEQKKNIRSIFSDYKEISGSGQSADRLEKTYEIDGNGGHSTIDAEIYIFSDSKYADNYFSASQKFYDNENYIPLDPLRSKKEGSGVHYLVSGIKSQYLDYTDFIYLPSKITYKSDVIIEYDNIIFHLRENANKAVTNKDAVIKDIKSKLDAAK